MQSRCFSLWCAFFLKWCSTHLANHKTLQSAFIAGVQAQIVSFTIQLPVTPLSRAANLFGFVGLILDINGTIAGVYDTLFVQGHIRDLTAMLTYNSDLQKQIRDSKEASKEGQSIPDEQFNSFAEEMKKRYPSGKLTPTSWISFYFIAEHVQPTSSTSNSWLLLLKPFRALFLMPAQTMLFGIACLKLSIILFAGASKTLQREVWICCLVIFLSSMARLILHGKHTLNQKALNPMHF